MKVYVVGYTTAYEGGDITAVYSSREKAEASWQMRNAGPGDCYEILEFEMDADPDVDKPDIDRRPRYGPKTYTQHLMNEAFDRILISNLTAPSPFQTIKQMPCFQEKEIQFFAHRLSDSTENKS